MHRIAYAIALGCFSLGPFASKAQLSYQLDSTLLAIDLVVDSDRVNIPWEILWGPDDRLWMTDGPLITRWDPVTDVMDTLIDRGEGNGMGMALHPDFPSTPWVYAVFDSCAYYGACNRSYVLRFTYDALNDTLYNEELFTSFWHPGEHSGGRMVFDTDGYLLVTCSEFYPDPFSDGGPTLRLTDDGQAAPGNPWGDMRWTRGHRNPQGLALLPNGSVVNSELCNSGSEVDLLEVGNNYGWIEFDGLTCIAPDSCTSPLYDHTAPLTWFFPSVSGCEFYTGNAIPEFTNALLSCGLWSQGLVVARFNNALDSVVDVQHRAGGDFFDLQRIRDIAIKPDGSFYLITNDRFDARIRWVQPDGTTDIADAATERNGISLWPNPTNDRLILTAGLDDRVDLFDAQGLRVLAPLQRMKDRCMIDVSALGAGLYVVQCLQGNEMVSLRFVKQ